MKSPKLWLKLVLVALVGVGTVSAAGENLLASASWSKLAHGQPPARPWRVGDMGQGVGIARAVVPGLPGEAWVRIVDTLADKAAGARVAIPDVPAGKLSFRVLAADKGGTLGIYLGRNEASAAADRLVHLKINPSSRMSLGSAETRQETGATLEPGVAYHLYLRWGVHDGKFDIEFGEVRPTGDFVLNRLTVTETFPLAMLRITTDRSNTASDFLVGDLVLVSEAP